MNKPKVSVLMPVYNGRHYLKEAIESIINQTFTKWELIIIDDGSTDGSGNIIRQYSDNDSRIKYIANEQNMGLIKTLNKGIDYSNGEYIARMDADDVSHEDRLGIQVDFLDKNSDHILCGTNAWVVNNEGLKTGRITNLTQDKFLKIHLLFSVPFVHPSVMFRRNTLTDNRYSEDHKHVEDYELWLRLSKMGKIANIDQRLLMYRWHETNVSVQYAEYQSRQKDRIIKDLLLDLEITPSENELYCHKISFQQYTLGKETSREFNLFAEAENWFSKLLIQNRKKKLYDQYTFRAYLWSRWIVLCISQKKYVKAFCPKFASFNPRVLSLLSQLILFLKKK